MFRKVLICLMLASGLVAAPAALADTTTSSNWSGYAIHRTGVTFRRAQATWTQPTATCPGGQATYSSFWVGIGGYSGESDALEQTGTELDCSARGKSSSKAWYEIVPAPAQQIRTMVVRPGDKMSANVLVQGHQITLRLVDETRHKTFKKTFTRSTVDISSAEWIAEAPSTCVSANVCHVLPLTNFGSMRFSAAKAVTIHYQSGAISDSTWSTTKIILSDGAPVFPGLGGGSGGATPTALGNSGLSFGIHYTTAKGSAASAARAQSATSAGHGIQPGGARR
jgi:hypothetical protein